MSTTIRLFDDPGPITVGTESILVVRKRVGEATTVKLPRRVAAQRILIRDGKGDAATNPITVVAHADDGGGTVATINAANQSLDLDWFAGQWWQWNVVAGGDSLPSQTGQSGKVLGTNGSTLSWVDASGVLPAGIIVMWSGLLANVPSGWQICDGTNGTPDLRDKFIKGWTAGVDPGGTGGGAYTPAGTNSAPTFTGTAWSAPAIAWPAGVPTAANESAHTHSVTSNVSGTLTPAGTVAWPAGVPTISGITISDHASHTHTYTQVVNHVHTLATGTGATGNFSQVIGTVDTSSGGTGGSPTQTALGTLSGNPSGGVATGTTAGPPAAISHTVSSQGTIAWPAGVPTFTGTSNQAVAMTNNAVTSGAGSAHTHTLSWPAGVPTIGAYTPAGTNSAPAFTGTQATVEPTYYKLAFIMKL